MARSKERYRVTFGFQVEAKDSDEAHRKAKKNLKPKKDREDIDSFRVYKRGAL